MMTVCLMEKADDRGRYGLRCGFEYIDLDPEMEAVAALTLGASLAISEGREGVSNTTFLLQNLCVVLAFKSG